MSRNLVKATGQNGGFGENGKAGKISPKVLTKVKYFMQMNWLKGPIESGGFGENSRFGETGEISPTFFNETGRFYANELVYRAHRKRLI